jgi:deoxyribodipyrimidine photolyase-related protein
MKTLRLILGDQLNHQHSWFREVNPNVTYLFVEARSESEYVTHHIQKIVGFFASMRGFAQKLAEQGHQVRYITILSEENSGSIPNQIRYEIEQNYYELFEYQEPDEYRLDVALKKLSTELNCTSSMLTSEHFLAPRDGVQRLFKGKKTYLMETFYRYMRKRFSILMEEEQPIGGQWNYDADNRMPFKNQIEVPNPNFAKNDISVVYDDVKKANLPHFGSINPTEFQWPITRQQALEWLDFFCKKQLRYFGTYEDAMHTNHEVLFHSRLSFALNIKLLHPKEVVDKVIETWHKKSDEISLNQVEGFVRQVIGWREFMRGVYWAQMPDFANMNYFNHQRKLPDWYWSGETNMNCLKHAITQSLDKAWAHHIQRLMVTGNFALLAGIHPDEVDSWYLGIYIDAIEWVEITNTRGMSQFADGGLIATKPYISSANYIDKMSNYCQGCYYDKKAKTGAKACPFNSLYWHFYERNREKLEKNPRVGMMYKTWEKMHPHIRKEIIEQAEFYLQRINQL